MFPKSDEMDKLKKIINSGKVNNSTKPEIRIKYMTLKK